MSNLRALAAPILLHIEANIMLTHNRQKVICRFYLKVSVTFVEDSHALPAIWYKDFWASLKYNNESCCKQNIFEGYTYVWDAL